MAVNMDKCVRTAGFNCKPFITLKYSKARVYIEHCHAKIKPVSLCGICKYVNRQYIKFCVGVKVLSKGKFKPLT